MGGHKEECWSLGLVELEFTAHFETGLEHSPFCRRRAHGCRTSITAAPQPGPPSMIFHTRDFNFTEKLDYFAAGASVLYGLYYTPIRVFR